MTKTMNRRAALKSTVAGALALPAGAAPALAAVAVLPHGAVELPAGDPLIAMWAERQRAKAAAEAGEYGPNEDDLIAALYDVEQQIAETAPTSPEGAAIVATIQLHWYAEIPEEVQDLEAVAGSRLARYILANTPADVLRRAGLEG